MNDRTKLVLLAITLGLCMVFSVTISYQLGYKDGWNAVMDARFAGDK